MCRRPRLSSILAAHAGKGGPVTQTPIGPLRGWYHRIGLKVPIDRTPLELGNDTPRPFSACASMAAPAGLQAQIYAGVRRAILTGSWDLGHACRRRGRWSRPRGVARHDPAGVRQLLAEGYLTTRRDLALSSRTSCRRSAAAPRVSAPRSQRHPPISRRGAAMGGRASDGCARARPPRAFASARRLDLFPVRCGRSCEPRSAGSRAAARLLQPGRPAGIARGHRGSVRTARAPNASPTR